MGNQIYNFLNYGSVCYFHIPSIEVTYILNTKWAVTVIAKIRCFEEEMLRSVQMLDAFV